MQGRQNGMMEWEVQRAEKLGINMEDFDDIGQFY